MAISIRFQGGPRAGEVLSFGDDAPAIEVGRDPARCQVVFPPHETRVGRQHCELRCELGRYRLVLNRDNPVFVNGQRAMDGEELPAEADVQLGVGGPVLVLQTTLRGDLPPTAGRQAQPGLATRLRFTESAARSGRRVALLALTLGLGVSVAVYAWRMSTEQRLSGVEHRVLELRELSSAEKKVMAQVSRRLGDVDGRVQKLEPQLAQALAEARKSVYLVLERNDAQSALAFGTCWVVSRERGLLATNSHVAELFAGLPQGGKWVVKACAPETHEFTIDRVEMHPGYEAFQKLWDTFDPVRRSAHGASQPIEFGATGCDVALLHVQEGEKLGPNLPLASAEELALLAAGEPIGYVGFPMEGLRLGGVNVVSPTPVTHFAYVVAVTDYFGGGTAPLAERVVVQHALPTAGGASGSPIVNRSGHVVAIHSAGNVVGKLDGVRLNSTAMINYAQRSDLLAEVLAGEAARKLPAREQTWVAAMERYYVRRPQLAREFEWEDVRDAFTRDLEASGEYQARVTPVAGLYDVALVATKPPLAPGWETRLELPAGGSYRVAVQGKMNTDLFFTLAKPNASPRDREIRGLQFQGQRNVRLANVPAPQPVSLRLRANSVDPQENVHLSVFHGTRERHTPAELLSRLGQRWLTGFARAKQAPPPALVVHEEASQLTEIAVVEGESLAAHSLELSLNHAGDYLVCVATGGESVGLAVFQGAAEQPLGTHEGSWISQAVRLAGPERVRVLITSDVADVKYELRVIEKGEAP